MTRKLLLIILFSLSVFGIHAQDSKFLVGGQMGTSFQNKKIDGNSWIEYNYDLSTALFFGYYATNQLVIGSELMLLYSNKYTNDYDEYKNVSIDFTFNPLVRYYFRDFFIQLQFNIGKSNSRVEIRNSYDTSAPEILATERNYNILGTSLGVGYDIKLSDKIFIEPQLRYNQNSYANTSDNVRNYTKGGMFFNIGLIYRW